MREEIAKKKECINCGICAYYCKDNAISFVEGSDGFEYPCKKDSCLECGLCSKHCIMNQKELTKNNIQNDIQAYIGKYKSSDEVKKSTSGGFCNAISEWVIEQDGVVFGVAYSSDFRKVIYQLVESKEQLKVLRSVKYAQASHLDIKNLEKELQTRRLVLVIGLPCVITAINKWAENKYNNLLTVALICHGPTSILVHRKFLDEVIRKERVNYLNLRKKRGNRRTGWLVMCGDNGKSFVKPWASTTYAAAFNILVRKSCYSCRFKIDTIQADYLVGDYWGRGTKKIKNKQGLSAIISLNSRSRYILEELKSYSIDDMLITEILKDNPALNLNIKEHPQREYFVNCLNSMELSEAVSKVIPKKKKIYSMIRAYALVILPNDIQYVLQTIIRKIRSVK